MMNRVQRAVSATLTAGVAVLNPSMASAQIYGSGRTVTVIDRKIEFEQPVKACLKLCVDTVVERQTFECVPYFKTPTEGCDLPWIDPTDPNPDPWGQGLGCVPPKPEIGGYLLRETVQLIQKRVRQPGDCTSSVTESVLQDLPDQGNPPRPCPDPGPWVSTNETIR